MLKLLASLFLIITLGTAQGAYAGPFEVGMDWYNGDVPASVEIVK